MLFSAILKVEIRLDSSGCMDSNGTSWNMNIDEYCKHDVVIFCDLQKCFWNKWPRQYSTDYQSAADIFVVSLRDIHTGRESTDT